MDLILWELLVLRTSLSSICRNHLWSDLFCSIFGSRNVIIVGTFKIIIARSYKVTNLSLIWWQDAVGNHASVNIISNYIYPWLCSSFSRIWNHFFPSFCLVFILRRSINKHWIIDILPSNTPRMKLRSIGLPLNEAKRLTGSRQNTDVVDILILHHLILIIVDHWLVNMTLIHVNLPLAQRLATRHDRNRVDLILLNHLSWRIIYLFPCILHSVFVGWWHFIRASFLLSLHICIIYLFYTLTLVRHTVQTVLLRHHKISLLVELLSSWEI